MTISGQPSRTDWDRVRKSIARRANPLRPQRSRRRPYDPNDDEAVDRFLTETNRVRPSAKKNEPSISKAS